MATWNLDGEPVDDEAMAREAQMSERMSTVFRHLSVWLRSRAIDPAGVEVTLTFDHRRGRDAAAFAIGKELEDHALKPKMPSHINEGTLMGIRFKLEEKP